MKRKDKPVADIEEIDIALPIMQKVRRDSSQNSKWAFELPINKFIKAMSMLHPQSYGARIEEYICKHCLKLKRTDNKDRGDRKSINGEYYEHKVSIFSSTNTALNLVQIRPWQDTGYIFSAFDIRDLNNIKTQLFLLNKNQFEIEENKCKISSAHGSKSANLGNSKQEKAMRIEVDSDNYNRWVNEYGISLNNLYIKLNFNC